VFERFGNPFFPYWNGIFRSALYDPSNLSDRLYLPRSLRDALAYPFLWFIGNNTTAQIPFTDARFAVISVLLIPAAVMLTRSVVNARRIGGQTQHIPDRAFVKRMPALFISSFFLTSYALWLGFFSEQRFAVPLELRSGVFLVILCDFIGGERFGKVLLALVLSFLIIGCMRTSSWGRVPWSHTWFDVSLPQELLDNNAVYLKPEHRNAYLIPFFPADARFFGIGTDTRLDRAIKQIVDRHNGPRRVLAYDQIERRTGDLLKGFGYQIDNCVGFSSKNDRFVVCDLIRWQEGELLKVPLPHRPAP